MAAAIREIEPEWETDEVMTLSGVLPAGTFGVAPQRNGGNVMVTHSVPSRLGIGPVVMASVSMAQQ